MLSTLVLYELVLLLLSRVCILLLVVLVHSCSCDSYYQILLVAACIRYDYYSRVVVVLQQLVWILRILLYYAQSTDTKYQLCIEVLYSRVCIRESTSSQQYYATTKVARVLASTLRARSSNLYIMHYIYIYITREYYQTTSSQSINIIIFILCAYQQEYAYSIYIYAYAYYSRLEQQYVNFGLFFALTRRSPDSTLISYYYYSQCTTKYQLLLLVCILLEYSSQLCIVPRIHTTLSTLRARIMSGSKPHTS